MIRNSQWKVIDLRRAIRETLLQNPAQDAAFEIKSELVNGKKTKNYITSCTDGGISHLLNRCGCLFCPFSPSSISTSSLMMTTLCPGYLKNKIKF